MYDAREEQPGWDQVGFTPAPGKEWRPVDTNFTVVARLGSQGMPPIEAVRELPALSVTRVNLSYTPTLCAAGVPEGQPATVACPGSIINAVTFVSFGLPNGSCTAGVHRGTCGTTDNLTAAVASICVGQESCSVTCVGRVPPPYPNGQCTLTNAPGGATKLFVEGEPCGPVKKQTALTVACKPLPPDLPRYKYVYDFGQEFAGVVRLTLPPGTPAGTRATLKHAEALAHPPLAPADGSVYMGNLFWANPVDVYIAKGGTAPEVYEPSFTYHGFRYVELLLEPPDASMVGQRGSQSTGPPEPGLESVVGVNLRSSVGEVSNEARSASL